MGEKRVNIHFDATTVSNNYNDGQETIHEAVRRTWEKFSGGYINSSWCDPAWYVGKGQGFSGTGGTPVDRHFTTVAFFDKPSATALLLDHFGVEKFTQMFLESSKVLRDTLEERGVTNFRLEI